MEILVEPPYAKKKTNNRRMQEHSRTLDLGTRKRNISSHIFLPRPALILSV